MPHSPLLFHHPCSFICPPLLPPSLLSSLFPHSSPLSPTSFSPPSPPIFIPSLLFLPPFLSFLLSSLPLFFLSYSPPLTLSTFLPPISLPPSFLSLLPLLPPHLSPLLLSISSLPPSLQDLSPPLLFHPSLTSHISPPSPPPSLSLTLHIYTAVMFHMSLQDNNTPTQIETKTPVTVNL